jgi:DNA-binding FadR family transcriptional regulator
MPVSRIRSTPRVYKQIVEQIKGLIEGSEYRPGAKLPPERELAYLLGVSRPSVREAMIMLEAAGLVEVRNGSGTYVRQVVASDAQAILAENDPGPGPLEQFEARMAVEPRLARMAAERITESELAHMEHVVERMGATGYLDATGPDRDELGYKFHVTLARASRNTILANLVVSLWEMRKSDMWVSLRQRVVRPSHRAQAYADRREILSALKRRDGETAERMMTAMLERAKARYFDD